jgi:hypothetical protein
MSDEGAAAPWRPVGRPPAAGTKKVQIFFNNYEKKCIFAIQIVPSYPCNTAINQLERQ